MREAVGQIPRTTYPSTPLKVSELSSLNGGEPQSHSSALMMSP